MINLKSIDADIKKLPFTVDSGAGERARIGLLVLESDQSLEWEMRQITNISGVSVYHSRLANDAIVTSTNLAMMEEQLPVATKLLPDYLNLSSIGYGCTSASTIIGEDKVSEILNNFHPDVPSTNPLTAAKVAFESLNISKIALLTPYAPDVTAAIQEKFNEAGITVALVGSYYEEDDKVVGRIDEESILQSVISLGLNESCDGVFISCTSLRALNIIEKAERVIGKPVTSSNHALAWHLLRLAGIDDILDEYGQLFKK
ncbi:Asp/Glu racemase [bacterium]|nr:Asp/Glu racemase [bacterium]